MIQASSVSTPLLRIFPSKPSLGVLSIHLDGAPCRVGCAFCYLGARSGAGDAAGLDLGLLEALLGRLDFAEVAVAVSEPAEGALGPLGVIARAAAARGRPLSITTTAQVLARTPAVLDGASRLNLSVDPWKWGPSLSAERIAHAAAAARGPAPTRTGQREIVLIVTLTDPGFCERLFGEGLLGALVDLPEVDRVALNALKPPPPWCGRAFWLRTAARIAPLLERALDRRLFLDCWVAARILGLGGCPARPDLSPAPGPPGTTAFRGCVYQPAAELEFRAPAELLDHLKDFAPPARCPFPIP
jgi:hypothetical protein